MTDIELSQLYYLFHYVRNTWIFAHCLDEETDTKHADLLCILNIIPYYVYEHLGSVSTMELSLCLGVSMEIVLWEPREKPKSTAACACTLEDQAGSTTNRKTTVSLLILCR